MSDKKERVFGIIGTEYAEEQTLIIPHIETLCDFLKEEISNLPETEERDYTVRVMRMTTEEFEKLPEFDG